MTVHRVIDANNMLFKKRTEAEAALELACITAWLTECQLSTLVRMERLKKVPKYDLHRQRQIANDAVLHCFDMGVQPKGLRGMACPLLAERLIELTHRKKNEDL
jgi:hypothetical protein